MFLHTDKKRFLWHFQDIVKSFFCCVCSLVGGDNMAPSFSLTFVSLYEWFWHEIYPELEQFKCLYVRLVIPLVNYIICACETSIIM